MNSCKFETYVTLFSMFVCVCPQIIALEVALQSPECAKPHLLAAAVPRQGHAIACDLLQANASTSDQRNGLQLVKALGLGYLLPAGLI